MTEKWCRCEGTFFVTAAISSFAFNSLSPAWERVRVRGYVKD